MDRTLIDLRSTCEAANREEIIDRVLYQLECAGRHSGHVKVVWPGDNDVSFVSRAAHMPLANFVVLVASAWPSVEFLIVARTASAAQFLAVALPENVRVAVQVNSEEAALRWERNDPDPARRIAAARRLRDAGVNCDVTIGPVRLFDGWKDEYADVAARVAEAGFETAKVGFDLESGAFPELGKVGSVDYSFTRTGVRFGFRRGQRKRVENFVRQCLSPVAA